MSRNPLHANSGIRTQHLLVHMHLVRDAFTTRLASHMLDMAHGHTIPMLDIARLFATRGIKSTIITTPLNVPSFSDPITRDQQANLDISLQVVQFPSLPTLPQGCENIDSLTSPDMVQDFFKAITMLEEQVEKLLQELHPHCIVADMFFPWTTDLGKRYGIPRLVFHGMGCFPHCLSENLNRYTPFKNIESDTEIFVVPGLPDPIEMTRSQLGDHVLSHGPSSEIIGLVERTEPRSFGVIVNSFYELEPAYNEYYRKEMGRKAWSIGPVSLYNKNSIDIATRGKKSLIDEQFWSNWLGSKEPNSVLYVCFGSAAQFGTAQLLEIATGLEASEVPFIWVVRTSKDVDKGEFPPKGFQERMEGKGLIITDWAPQVLILDHLAIGGFMTHCGWNSILEGITAGLPLITWPLFADQFYNEKLVTQVLKTGISAGSGIWSQWVGAESVAVSKEMVEKAVTEVMKSSVDMRSRAREIGEMAKKSVEEGGSSFNNLNALIDELKFQSQTSK